MAVYRLNAMRKLASGTMTVTPDISDDLQARIDAIAARFNLSPAEIVADALQNGNSIDWQERFLDRVAQGV